MTTICYLRGENPSLNQQHRKNFWWWSYNSNELSFGAILVPRNFRLYCPSDRTSFRPALGRRYIPITLYIFLEVQGSLGESSEIFITRLCKLLCRSHDDQRAGSFLKQRISMALQIGNAACVLGTVSDRDAFEEILTFIKAAIKKFHRSTA